jgi:sec-independent protein translocase protein TatC
MGEEPADDGDESVPDENRDDTAADERSSDEEPQDTADSGDSPSSADRSKPRSYRPETDDLQTTESDGDEASPDEREQPPRAAAERPSEPPHTDPETTADDPPGEFSEPSVAPSPDEEVTERDTDRMLPDEDVSDDPDEQSGAANGVEARTDGSHAESDVGVPGPGSTGTDEYDDAVLNQPPDDEEMPLADHIEEMVQRLAVVLFFAAVVTLLVFPFAQDVIITMWYALLPQADVAAPHVYGPLELKLTELKLASLAGLTLALPVAVYETYLFMRPGLYPRERRYYLAAVPSSLVLAVVGLAFGYFLVLPGLFTYFLYYSDVTANVAFGLRETFNLILTMMGMLAVVFQIPLCIMLAIMMGVTSRAWLAENRLYFWGAFLGLAFLFSPDPTGMAPLIVAVTMVGLYEGTLLLLRWVGR